MTRRGGPGDPHRAGAHARNGPSIIEQVFRHMPAGLRTATARSRTLPGPSGTGRPSHLTDDGRNPSVSYPDPCAGCGGYLGWHPSTCATCRRHMETEHPDTVDAIRREAGRWP
jgi:hypothetical protein